MLQNENFEYSKHWKFRRNFTKSGKFESNLSRCIFDNLKFDKIREGKLQKFRIFF